MMGTYVVGGVLIVIISLIIRKLYKDLKTGKSCGGCSGCSTQMSCNHK